MIIQRTYRRLALCATLALLASGCTHNGDLPSSAVPSAGDSSQTTDLVVSGDASGASVLKMLDKKVVIGSTVDSLHHQLNPYGLDVAHTTSGIFTKGDLAVCNFNAKSNVQGTGYTIVALHPEPGAKPRLVSANKSALEGCNALALAHDDDEIWAASFVANSNPVISANGSLEANLHGTPYDRPFGQTVADQPNGKTFFYESNAGDGTIVRIQESPPFHASVIARGFAINHGKPGSILGPSGLNYDRSNDTLYVVDGTNNTLVAIGDLSNVTADSIRVSADGMHFTGTGAAHTRLVYAGAPLNGPISSALLFNGNLVLGNTLDPNGKNLMVEISSAGKLLAVRNVDRGAAGSLFGMVATGTNAMDTRLYFNDDNNNDLQVLENPGK